jgi:hypothetical protein
VFVVVSFAYDPEDFSSDRNSRRTYNATFTEGSQSITRRTLDFIATGVFVGDIPGLSQTELIFPKPVQLDTNQILQVAATSVTVPNAVVNISALQANNFVITNAQVASIPDGHYATHDSVVSAVAEAVFDATKSNVTRISFGTHGLVIDYVVHSFANAVLRLPELVEYDGTANVSSSLYTLSADAQSSDLELVGSGAATNWEDLRRAEINGTINAFKFRTLGRKRLYVTLSHPKCLTYVRQRCTNIADMEVLELFAEGKSAVQKMANVDNTDTRPDIVAAAGFIDNTPLVWQSVPRVSSETVVITLQIARTSTGGVIPHTQTVLLRSSLAQGIDASSFAIEHATGVVLSVAITASRDVPAAAASFTLPAVVLANKTAYFMPQILQLPTINTLTCIDGMPLLQFKTLPSGLNEYSFQVAMDIPLGQFTANLRMLPTNNNINNVLVPYVSASGISTNSEYDAWSGSMAAKLGFVRGPALARYADLYGLGHLCLRFNAGARTIAQLMPDVRGPTGQLLIQVGNSAVTDNTLCVINLGTNVSEDTYAAPPPQWIQLRQNSVTTSLHLRVVDRQGYVCRFMRGVASVQIQIQPQDIN